MDTIRRARESQPRTVLIIEDDEMIRQALRRIVESEGCRVLLAKDALELGSVISGQAIDLIILDVGLPWINGYEMAELMRKDENLKNLPLVFVSGESTLEAMKKGFQVGADDYITKPFEIDVVKKSIRTLLRLHYN